MEKQKEKERESASPGFLMPSSPSRSVLSTPLRMRVTTCLDFHTLLTCARRPVAFINIPKWYNDPDINKGLLAAVVHIGTHELGHMLGLEHQKDCATGCEDLLKGSCIMHPVSEYTTGFWSECSKAQIRGVLQKPYLSLNKSKQCLFTKDAFNLNDSFNVPFEAPGEKTISKTTTTMAASSIEQGGTSEAPATPERDHHDIIVTTISAKMTSSSSKTWIIIGVCVLVAIIVIIVLWMLCKRLGPPVSRSSRKVHITSQIKTDHKMPEKRSKNRRPTRSVSRQSSRDSLKSRRVASPEHTGSHMRA